MEKLNSIQIIESRKLVATPGSYELKVTSVTPFEDKFIANFAAMTPYHLGEAKRLITEGEFQEATNQNISASLRPTDYIPAKGEIVKVYLDNVTTKSGVTGLFVTSVSEVKARTTTKVSLGFDDVDAEIPASKGKTKMANSLQEA